MDFFNFFLFKKCSEKNLIKKSEKKKKHRDLRFNKKKKEGFCDGNHLKTGISFLKKNHCI